MRPPQVCKVCDTPHTTHHGHAACKGHKRTGEGCHNAPLDGLEVCRYHGGNAPRARAAGARRVQEQAAQQAVETLGLPVDVSPSDALLEEVRWTAGHVQWLRGKVQELQPKALVWGKTRTAVKVTEREFEGMAIESTEETVTREASLSLWYDLYERERRHLVTVCAAALRAGVEERRVRLAESQGELVAGVIRAILNDLGLSGEQEALVADVVPRHLRAIAG